MVVKGLNGLGTFWLRLVNTLGKNDSGPRAPEVLPDNDRPVEPVRDDLLGVLVARFRADANSVRSPLNSAVDHSKLALSKESKIVNRPARKMSQSAIFVDRLAAVVACILISASRN
jgi:hypothetical protein